MLSLVKDRLRQLRTLLKRTVIELNLFKVYPTDRRQLYQQRLVTRFYIAIVLSTCVTLTLHSSFKREIYREKVQNPTQSQFVYFQSLNLTSLRCPCSSISVSYNIYLSVEPHYHQICSSDFISPAWLSWLDTIASRVEVQFSDFTRVAVSHFHILAFLCEHANKTITDAREQLLQETYVTEQAVSEELFESQTAALIESWKMTTIKKFLQTPQLIQGIQHGNHLVAALYNIAPSLDVSGKLQMDSYQSHTDRCLCLLSASCNLPMTVSNFNIDNPDIYDTFFIVPNFFTGCSPVEAMLVSTLQCFYRQDCMDDLMRALNKTGQTIPNTTYVLLNKYQSQENETIRSVVNRLFVNNWSHTVSYTAYYQACLPELCTYEYTDRRNILSVLITSISIFGGLTTGLKIVFFILLRIIAKVRSDRSVHAHLHAINAWFLTLCNREQLTGRLSILLLIITSTIVYVLSAISSQTYTKYVLKPSFATSEQLHIQYPTLKCACSQFSIQQKDFMNVTITRQHQVCTSDFVSDRWIETLVLPNHLSSYSPYEFRKIAISHFQLLAFLCDYTEQYLNNEIDMFTTKNFIEPYLLSSNTFLERFESAISQFQVTTINSFLITLQLVRDTTSDNTLMSVFETNWMWTNKANNFTLGFEQFFRTKSVMYDTCDCGLTSKCVQPGTLPDNSTVPGFMVGCYPLESLFISTVECLFDASCFPLLQTLNGSFAPLDISVPSRYQLNSSIESIVSELMIEQWSSNMSYEKYYAQCAPSYCTYSYLKHQHVVDAITTLLELYGGLVIIINVITLALLKLCKKIINKCRQTNRIQPDCN